MPTPQIMLPALWDVICNFLYGFYEPSVPTDEAKTVHRREMMISACQRFLEHAAQSPGDLLDSQTRSEFAKEAFEAYGTTHNDDNNKNYEYKTKSKFRDVACKIVQDQHALDEAYYNTFVQRLQEEYPSKTEEDCRAMAIELSVLAAGCDGVRTFCHAINKTIEFPETPKTPVPALFEHVSDYSSSPLKYMPAIAWGPFLTLKDLKQEIITKHKLTTNLWKFASLRHAPISNATAVPTTCEAAMDFFQVMYVPLPYFPRFLRVPGPDRHLARGQIEPAAATYTAAKHCRFWLEAHDVFAHFSGPVVMNKTPQLAAESRELGTALALHEGVEEARQALLGASNEHALLDVAGIIAWHALISKVVDVAGFYTAKVPNIIRKLGAIATFCHKVRDFVFGPFRNNVMTEEGSKVKKT